MAWAQALRSRNLIIATLNRRGPGRGGSDLRIRVTFSQTRLATPISAVRLAAAARQLQQYKQRITLAVLHQARPSSSKAFGDSRVRNSRVRRQRRRHDPSMVHSSQLVRDRRACLSDSSVPDPEVTLYRSPAHQCAHSFMPHALVDVRLSCALSLCFSHTGQRVYGSGSRWRRRATGLDRAQPQQAASGASSDAESSVPSLLRCPPRALWASWSTCSAVSVGWWRHPATSGLCWTPLVPG